jgi:putative sterol carrier protein
VADKYEFLSDEWVEAAHKIRDEVAGDQGPQAPPIKMNLVITEVPFKDGGGIDAHIDTTSGDLQMALQHVDAPDVTLTLAYATARSFFIDQDVNAVMQAFMSGQLKVQGDMTKLMALQAQAPNAVAAEASERIKAITA